MATIRHSSRPLTCLKQSLRTLRRCKTQQRTLATLANGFQMNGDLFQPWELIAPNKKPKNAEHKMKTIPVFSAPPTAVKTCKEPLKTFDEAQKKALDPRGSRTRLFAKTNPEAAKVGDIMLVRLRNGDPFAGVCLNIRRRGVESAILLRNHLTRVGVEMWFKIYSPLVDGIEVVQRRQKRARRAKLYYMRHPKHDVGSVENIVTQYIRKRGGLRTGDVRSRDANAGKKKKKT